MSDEEAISVLNQFKDIVINTSFSDNAKAAVAEAAAKGVAAIREMTKAKSNKPSNLGQSGFWIKDKVFRKNDYSNPRYQCSICSRWADFDYNFCPHCGVRMEGKGHD